ncbi:MAG: Nif11-like leader peptide family RiPP precursor [Xenococcaceae cyanobacterium]
MSIEVVNQFLQKLSEEASLQEQLAKALNSKNARQKATDLGSKNGYIFTPDERSIKSLNYQSSEEISEEDLEAVAGSGKLSDFLDRVFNPQRNPRL